MDTEITGLGSTMYSTCIPPFPTRTQFPFTKGNRNNVVSTSLQRQDVAETSYALLHVHRVYTWVVH